MQLDSGATGVIKATALLTGLAGAATGAPLDIDDHALIEELSQIGRRTLGLRQPRRQSDAQRNGDSIARKRPNLLTGLAGAATGAPLDIDDHALIEELSQIGRRTLGLRQPRRQSDAQRNGDSIARKRPNLLQDDGRTSWPRHDRRHPLGLSTSHRLFIANDHDLTVMGTVSTEPTCA